MVGSAWEHDRTLTGRRTALAIVSRIVSLPIWLCMHDGVLMSGHASELQLHYLPDQIRGLGSKRLSLTMADWRLEIGLLATRTE